MNPTVTALEGIIEWFYSCFLVHSLNHFAGCQKVSPFIPYRGFDQYMSGFCLLLLRLPVGVRGKVELVS